MARDWLVAYYLVVVVVVLVLSFLILQPFLSSVSPSLVHSFADYDWSLMLDCDWCFHHSAVFVSSFVS